MDGWNTCFLLGNPIFRCYVSFREGIVHIWYPSISLPCRQKYSEKEVQYEKYESIQMTHQQKNRIWSFNSVTLVFTPVPIQIKTTKGRGNISHPTCHFHSPHTEFLLPGGQVIIDPPWVAHIPYHLGFQGRKLPLHIPSTTHAFRNPAYSWRLSSEKVSIIITPRFTRFYPYQVIVISGNINCITALRTCWSRINHLVQSECTMCELTSTVFQRSEWICQTYFSSSSWFLQKWIKIIEVFTDKRLMMLDVYTAVSYSQLQMSRNRKRPSLHWEGSLLR